ncbi:hypothetical protein RE428_15100 [Marinobacter nanhaiticus D15-8W]|nr:hypothetical protein RE428_15100 [Marinobacter nanhaiticus D15-8W]
MIRGKPLRSSNRAALGGITEKKAADTRRLVAVMPPDALRELLGFPDRFVKLIATDLAVVIHVVLLNLSHPTLCC